MLTTPVLFIVYKRPDTTTKVFNAIKAARPAKLFVAADGPKNADEEERCRLVRDIATQVDWPCELHTLFHNRNVGVARGGFEATTWFFDNVEQGIILEDDCLPDISFFEFCEILLNKYADDHSIFAISGTNLLNEGWLSNKQSYHFGHGGVWGWATWRRAWQLYDFDMPDWKDKTNQKKIRKAMGNTNWFDIYYKDLYQWAYDKEIGAWDLQWLHCIFNNGGRMINPSVNLVKNIGFGPEASNTVGADSPYATLELKQMTFPLKGPKKIKIDKKYLRATFKYIFEYNNTFERRMKSWVRLYLNRFKNIIN